MLSLSSIDMSEMLCILLDAPLVTDHDQPRSNN